MIKTDSEAVIRALKEIFSVFGIPEIVRRDRGPQFNSFMFRKFANDFSFRLSYSDPFYPQGNGCAERAVQVANRMYKQNDPISALMAYRTVTSTFIWSQVKTIHIVVAYVADIH